MKTTFSRWMFQKHGSLITKIYVNKIRNPYFKFCRKWEPSLWKSSGILHQNTSEVYQSIQQAIQNGTPFATGRIGGTERYAVLWHLGKKVPEGRLHDLHRWSGVFPDDLQTFRDFTSVYADGLRKLDLLGLWYGKKELWIYKKIGMSASVCDFYDFSGRFGAFASGSDQGWFHALKGKKVMVISSFASLIQERCTEEMWNNIWAGRIPWFEPAEIIPADFPYGFDAEAEKEYGDSLRLLERFKTRFAEDLRRADVVLAGCGAYAIPLLAWAKEEGKVGIHLAGQIQLLFGIRGHRWDVNPAFSEKLYNEHWIHPPEKYIPKSAANVENSCYW